MVNQSRHTEPSGWSRPSQDLLTQIKSELVKADLPPKILPDPKGAVDTMVNFGHVVQDTKERLSKGETVDSMDLSGAKSNVEKMDSINPMVRERMGQDIRKALRESGDRMRPDERDFWEGLGDAVEKPAEWWNAAVSSERASEEEKPHDFSGAICWCGGRGAHGGQTR